MSGKDKILDELIDKIKEQHCSASGRKKEARNTRGKYWAKSCIRKAQSMMTANGEGGWRSVEKVKGVSSTD